MRRHDRRDFCTIEISEFFSLPRPKLSMTTSALAVGRFLVGGSLAAVWLRDTLVGQPVERMTASTGPRD